jgi:hypothetical protein
VPIVNDVPLDFDFVVQEPEFFVLLNGFFTINGLFDGFFSGVPFFRPWEKREPDIRDGSDDEQGNDYNRCNRKPSVLV